MLSVYWAARRWVGDAGLPSSLIGSTMVAVRATEAANLFKVQDLQVDVAFAVVRQRDASVQSRGC